jgi:hypothetical protein
MAAHLGHYALLLALPLGGGCPAPPGGKQGTASLLRRLGRGGAAAGDGAAVLLPPSLLWHSTVDAEGNQRIANSLMLALGVALSLWQATQVHEFKPRLAWMGLAALIARWAWRCRTAARAC